MPRSVLRLFLAVLTITLAQAFSEPLILKKFASDHFAILIPSGWVEMSKADLDELAAALAAAAPKAEPQSLNYGFQFSSDAPYPRVLVQIRRTGRISEDTIQKLLKKDVLGKDFSSATATRNLQVGKVSWDAQAAIFWTEMETDRPDGVSMIVLTGMHPTEFGAVTVHCQATESDFERFGPTLRAVVSSVNVDTQFRYRERSLFARAAESITVPALIGSGCALGAYGMLRRRRRAEGGTPDRGTVASSGAVWKVPLGFLLAIGHLNSLMHALDGDGWLQTTAEAQGYWFAWGLFLSVGLLLIYSAGRALGSR